METLSFITIIAKLLVIIDPIGGTPTIIALTKDFEFRKQRWIILREVLFGLIIALFFQYLGDYFLSIIAIQPSTLRLAGGILLFLVALDMIFSPSTSDGSTENPRQKQDPFIFPIATPLLAGPGLLTMTMLLSQSEPNPLKISLAICAAWIVVTLILAFAPHIQKILKRTGLTVLEQIMGMVLMLMSIDMIMSGARLFIEGLKQ